MRLQPHEEPQAVTLPSQSCRRCCHCQYDRYRSVHEPRFSVGRHSIRACHHDALGHRRALGSLWRPELCRAGRSPAPLRRRVPLSNRDLPSLCRLHFRLGLGDRGVCSTDCAGRTHIRQLSEFKRTRYRSCVVGYRGHRRPDRCSLQFASQ